MQTSATHLLTSRQTTERSTSVHAAKLRKMCSQFHFLFPFIGTIAGIYISSPKFIPKLVYLLPDPIFTDPGSARGPQTRALTFFFGNWFEDLFKLILNWGKIYCNALIALINRFFFFFHPALHTIDFNRIPVFSQVASPNSGEGPCDFCIAENIHVFVDFGNKNWFTVGQVNFIYIASQPE